MIWILIISYVVYQLWEAHREENAPYMTLEELKGDLAQHNAVNEHFMGW